MKGQDKEIKLFSFFKERISQYKKNIYYILCLPALLVLAVTSLVAFFGLFYLSLHKYNFLINPDPTFAWFFNYKNLFASKEFYNTFFVTVKFTVNAIFFETILAIAFSHLFLKPFKGINFFRSIMLIPMITTPVVVGLCWRILLNTSRGIINYAISLVGISPIEWLTNPNLALSSLVIVDVWEWTPFLTLLFLAGLQSLPIELYEAGKIDGANGFQTLIYITLPLLKPIIIIGAALRAMVAFRWFDTIYIMTFGGPGRATEVLSMYITLKTFRYWDIGYGSAAAFFTLLFLAFATVILFRALGVVKNN